MALGSSSLLLLVLLAWSCYTALSSHNRIIYSNDINCTEDDDNDTIRIFGSNPEQGMLQVCKNGKWHAVCGVGWDCDNAKVACRQLGFTEGRVVHYPYCCSRFGSWSYRENIWYQCNGTEESLSECKSRPTYCSTYNVAGIYCEEIEENEETPECENNSVRLVDGNSSHEGRVEVCYNGTWSSLCGISTKNAGVVCEKLGYSSHATVQPYGGMFGSSLSLGVAMNCDNVTKECSVFTSSSSGCRSPYLSRRNCSTAIHCHLPCNSSEIRIAYGSTPNRGLFQKCLNGVWHAQCRRNWGCTQAKVACRQLGHTGPLVYYPLSNSFSSNTYDSRYYYCRGNEKSLSECSRYSQYGRYGRCYPTYLAGLYCNSMMSESGQGECEENSVRLVGGKSRSEGRVEICYEGQWSSLCSVTPNVASTICKQLGLPNHATVLRSNSAVRIFGTSISNVNSVRCNTSATTLEDCTITPYESCTTSLYPRTRTCSTALKCHALDFCKEGDVRLAGGDIEQEGRVELCFEGVWTTICPNRWDATDGYIVCKQLGYASVPQLYNLDQTRPDLRPTLSSYTTCVGYENRLADCYKNTRLNGYCYYNYRPAIRCFDDCTEGAIRLVNGPTKSEGTIEICHNKLWGVINDNNWSNEEARVVCRQLRLPSQDAVALKNSYYGKPNLATHYRYIECNGAEDRLTQCPKSSLSLTVGKTQFKRAGAAGVSCKGRPSKLPCSASPPPTSATLGCTTNGAIRLSGGKSSNEGRLEYCYNGQWSPFCTLRVQEATVACNELGYTRAIWASVFTDGRFGETTSYSRFQNITCSNSASEGALRDCKLHETSCLPVCNNIGIRCYNPIKCNEGAVRLQNGVIEQEGRVEVCTNGVWGSVCDQSWNDTEAFVVCKQAGRPQQKAVAYHNSYFGDGDGPISYSSVSCGGWEKKLTDCSTKNYPSFSCSREQVAGVLCGDDCRDGDVQLVGGSSPLEGTVQICFNNIWGLISESGWGSFDAAVVCNQLGFRNRGAVAYGGSRFGKPNMTIQATEVTCDGDEKTLAECGLTTYSLDKGKTLINKVEVAGVSCQACPPGATGCSPVTPTRVPTPAVSTVVDRFDGVQQSSLGPLYAVIGVMAVAIAAAIAVLILLTVLISRKWTAYNKQLADLKKVPEKSSNVYADTN